MFEPKLPEVLTTLRWSAYYVVPEEHLTAPAPYRALLCKATTLPSFTRTCSPEAHCTQYRSESTPTIFADWRLRSVLPCRP